MNLRFHKKIKTAINHLMPLDTGFSRKRFGYDGDTEMALPFAIMACMPLVPVAVIKNFQYFGTEIPAQNIFDLRGNTLEIFSHHPLL